MRNLLFMLLSTCITVCWIGCAGSYPPPFIPIEVATGNIEYDQGIYYIVKPIDLIHPKGHISLTYLGTIPDYHLFRTWYKGLKMDVRISTFAVSKDDCIVDDERSPEELKDSFKSEPRFPRGTIQGGNFELWQPDSLSTN